jgi:hypothetical protein
LIAKGEGIELDSDCVQLISALRANAEGDWSDNLAHIPQCMRAAAGMIEHLHSEFDRVCSEQWLNRHKTECPDGEAVAWRWRTPKFGDMDWKLCPYNPQLSADHEVQPLYASPPPVSGEVRAALAKANSADDIERLSACALSVCSVPRSRL